MTDTSNLGFLIQTYPSHSFLADGRRTGPCSWDTAKIWRAYPSIIVYFTTSRMQRPPPCLKSTLEGDGNSDTGVREEPRGEGGGEWWYKAGGGAAPDAGDKLRSASLPASLPHVQVTRVPVGAGILQIVAIFPCLMRRRGLATTADIGSSG